MPTYRGGSAAHPLPTSRQRALRSRRDPGSKILLLALSNGTVKRWSIPDLRELAALRASDSIERVTFHQSGDLLALVLDHGGVELWSRPWHAPRVLMRSSQGVIGVGFAPDGQWLAVSMRDGTVRTWSSTGEVLGEPVRLTGMAFAAALNDPDTEPCPPVQAG